MARLQFDNADDKYCDIREPLHKLANISKGHFLFIELNGPYLKVSITDLCNINR